MPVSQSNFRVATNSAWLIFRGTSGNWGKFQTNGKTFVTLLQRFLRSAPALMTSTPAYDGVRVVGPDVVDDAEWADITNRALWVYLRANGATALTLQLVELAGRARQITRETATIAANVILRSMGYANPDPHIPANAVLPLYRTPLPGVVGAANTGPATAEELTAVGVSQPAAPASTSSTSTPATPSTPESPATPGKAQSDAPDNDGTGGKDPTGLPTGVPTTVTTSSGITAGAVLAVLAVVGGLGLLGASLMHSADARANPRKFGPKLPRFFVSREPLDSGGYTRRGEYFGRGTPLFRFYSDGAVDIYGRDTGTVSAFVHPDMEGVRYRDGYVDAHVRAADRAAAIQKIRAAFPTARFVGTE